MATHSSVFAWRIPGTGEPVGLPSVGSHRVGHDWCDLAAAASYPESCSWSSLVTTSDNTLNWRNFTTLCEKWLFEKVQLYSCLFCLTSFCQLIHRNCILQALTRENSSDLIFISCDMESCHFLLQPLFDLVYFWRQCLYDVLSSFWEEQHGYSFHICLRDL